MSLVVELRRRARFIAVPVIGIAVTGYFAYHGVQGERGLIALWQLRHDIKIAEASRDAIREERSILERRVSLLRPESLDADMLEERARLALGVGRKDEFVVLTQIK